MGTTRRLMLQTTVVVFISSGVKDSGHTMGERIPAKGGKETISPSFVKIQCKKIERTIGKQLLFTT
jgi:hypothetical protein